MTHNSEKDRYRNNGLVASFNNNLSDKFDFKSNARISETYLQYDAVCVTDGLFGCSSTRDHSEEADTVEASANLSLIHKSTDKFKNKFTLAQTYIKGFMLVPRTVKIPNRIIIMEIDIPCFTKEVIISI